ncbi:phytanoyl-CoA dioxygenase family protein [Micromonospora sp. RP3T]|uniref:phytanoyl-CoA dioxygenase family protein n=1 Tax=Micromonospora sp. RP3T TaxID=2135446 RepID=UPI003D764790
MPGLASTRPPRWRLFPKAEGRPGQAWHQDELFVPTRDRSPTAAWIALDDARVDNGCLWAPPGSSPAATWRWAAPCGRAGAAGRRRPARPHRWRGGADHHFDHYAPVHGEEPPTSPRRSPDPDGREAWFRAVR